MTNKTIHLDTFALTTAEGDIKARFETIKELAETWNSQQILPPFDGEILDNLLNDGPGYMQQEANRLLTEQLNSQGIRATLTADLEYDPERFDRTIESLKRCQFGPISSPHVHNSMVKYDSTGKPYLPKDINTQLKDKCSVKRTPEIENILTEMEAAAAHTTQAVKEIKKRFAEKGVPCNRHIGLDEVLRYDIQTETFTPNPDILI